MYPTILRHHSHFDDAAIPNTFVSSAARAHPGNTVLSSLSSLFIMSPTLSSQAITKRSADTALMPPPPIPKRIKRPVKVLDEDDYTDGLSHIIARDFFPGLFETRTQQEYLNALDSQDGDWIASAGRKLTEVMTPGPDGRRLRGRRGTSMVTSGLGAGQTPINWGDDTPMTSVTDMSEDESSMRNAGVDTNISLGNFQAKYTSEDNESFYRLLDKQNLKRAEKYAWMWAGNKIPAARQIAHRQRDVRLLEARVIQEAEDGEKNQLVALDEDGRKAMPDTWKARPDNQFMFAPDSIEDEMETLQQRAESLSKAPPKAVVYDNTRLPPPLPDRDHATPSSPSISAVQDAIAGRPRPSLSEPGFSGGETPRVNGYSFVDSAPSPTPSELGVPPLTWGTLESSPILLGSGDATPNPFSIKAKSKREDLHHRMVDKVARNKRKPGSAHRKVGKTPVPRFVSSPRVGVNLTPAAQRLWTKVGTPGGKTVFDGRTPTQGKLKESSLRHRWTPTPRAPIP
ncbi:MAG: hypothetical protein M1812_002194 [Candelaria pacifica]|nr:MAG: hypothetical protein M1812_002194 [Candelaria pacifica]